MSYVSAWCPHDQLTGQCAVCDELASLRGECERYRKALEGMLDAWDALPSSERPSLKHRIWDELKPARAALSPRSTEGDDNE